MVCLKGIDLLFVWTVVKVVCCFGVVAVPSLWVSKRLRAACCNQRCNCFDLLLFVIFRTLDFSNFGIIRVIFRKGA